MAKKPQFTFTVWFGDRDLPGFLDMMRYDGAQVESWDRVDSNNTPNLYGERNVWQVRLVGPRFTPDRWSSFGLRSIESDFQYV